MNRMDSTGSEDNVPETPSNYSSDEHSECLISNFEVFRRDGGYSDITVKVSGKEFPCHKVILAAGSPYFKSMFESGMEESRKSTIELRQVDGEVFEKVIHFIYTGHVQITASILQELFTQAYMFQVTSLVDLCVKFFKDNMDENNCLAALTLADSHAHQQLYEYAKEFACLHFSAISRDEDFCRLSSECVIDLLSDRRLRSEGEEQVYDAAIRWLDTDADTERRHGSRFNILGCVKFPMLRKTFLLDVVGKSQHIVSDGRGRELLEDAILYHAIPARRPQLPAYQITPRISSKAFETAVLLGGRLADGLSNDVEYFKSDSKEFASLKQLPFKKRNEFAACVIGNDIFVSGGLRSGEVWKYDSTFEQWIRGASLLHPRRRHAMAAVDDSIYVLGGFDEDTVLDSVEKWNGGSNKWREAGWLSAPVENMGYVSYGKYIYLFGGKNHMEMVTSSVQRYDSETSTSTLLNRPLPVGDMCLSAAVLNSQVYVVGLEGAFRFTPDTETWDVLPDMSCPRDFVSLTVLNEKLYAFGGRRRGAKDNLYTDIIECFDPKKNTWENYGTIPVPMYSYGCVRIVLGAKYIDDS
ncbi:hypothetical protein FSP39_007540 [Pinctada imbricata]|uniref:BTB domain-containing protein n=1 Tax=Pinctada imbricata TaxID=66713 RepID=A0AA88YBA3_PINIB|nr:hypothetical protein FSP39_007540 [Pinctada imbricata]